MNRDYVDNFYIWTRRYILFWSPRRRDNASLEGFVMLATLGITLCAACWILGFIGTELYVVSVGRLTPRGKDALEELKLKYAEFPIEELRMVSGEWVSYEELMICYNCGNNLVVGEDSEGDLCWRCRDV